MHVVYIRTFLSLYTNEALTPPLARSEAPPSVRVYVPAYSLLKFLSRRVGARRQLGFALLKAHVYLNHTSCHLSYRAKSNGHILAPTRQYSYIADYISISGESMSIAFYRLLSVDASWSVECRRLSTRALDESSRMRTTLVMSKITIFSSKTCQSYREYFQRDKYYNSP